MNPVVAGQCDRCQSGDFIRREDDNETTVRSRLKVYHEQTAPLRDYYQKKALLSKVNGMGAFDQVTQEICSILDKVLRAA